VNDALSIFAAAREAGSAPALLIGARCYSYEELARLTRERLRSLPAAAHAGRAVPVIGTNTLDTVLALYALLECGAPALLLHPKLTAAERAVEIDATDRAAHALPAGAAAILYTSGTTGRARGTVLTRAALIASAQASAANLGWQDDDRWLLVMPIARIGGLSIITRALAARRTVVLAPRFDAGSLPQQLIEQRVTLISLVPTMLALLLERVPDWTAPSHLRALLLGGAAASHALLLRARVLQLPLVLTYGCTETSSQVAATPYAQRYCAAECGAGRPLPGAEVRVVDGRIEVRGPMLMAGYLGETPLAAGAWFDTSDIGEIDSDGWLHVHARAGDLIVTGGNNVYPAEVERALEACAGVRAAGVFGVADTTWGETVAAALVVDGELPTPQALLDHLAARLAPHKRPRAICFVPELPQTAAGKVDRQALRALVSKLQPLRADAHSMHHIRRRGPGASV
jgi:O-succinylbenzoic acid--CoA ligase